MPAPDATFGLSETIYPVSYRYLLQTPFGQTSQEITVDLPTHAASYEVAAALGPTLWATTIATAISHQVKLLAFDMMIWKAMLGPVFLPVANTGGLLWEDPAPADESGVLVLHTWHGDGESRRRLFMPCVPQSWVSHGMLTTKGAEELQTLARGMCIGILEEAAGSQFTWLNAYPNLFPGGLIPGDRVGFRHVRGVRVCQYTERAPDRGAVVWP